jgi:DNA-binding CsgD family transcriptional regulator
MLPDDPFEYALDTLVENVDLRGLRPTLGGYPDQEYVKKDVIPFCLDAKKTGEFSRLRLKSRIQDQIAIYDRLLLPMNDNKETRWAMSITKTRLLLPAESRIQTLTERQEDILFLLSRGFSSKEVAQRLGTSHRTVEHQTAVIKTKLGARNLAHAIAIGITQSIA